MPRKIYAASSWRNGYQETVVRFLRDNGHEVYDFKNPEPGNNGFRWSDIDPNWKSWTPDQFKQALKHPIAQDGFKFDHKAMEWSDAGVLILPSGMSAHLEAGWLAGSGRPTCVYAPELREPELMYILFDHVGKWSQGKDWFCTTPSEVLDFLS